MGGPWEKYTSQDSDSSEDSGPWSKYASKSNSDDSSFDPSAAVQGFGNMAAAGYVPELTGAVGKMIPNPNTDVDAKLKAQGFNIQQPDFNGMTTDQSRAMQKQMSSDSPYSYYGGGVAGAVASAPAYGSALKGLGVAKTVAPLASDASFGAKAANLGSRALQAGKEGAALSAVSNPNTEVGDSGLNVDKRFSNAVVGGVLSSAVPVGIDAAKGAVSTSGGLAKWAGTKALSNIGGVKPEIINEYTQFADRINAAPNLEELKNISDEFVGKMAQDVQAKQINVDQAGDAFKAFQSDLKDAYKTAGYDARDAVASAQQTLKDAHNTRIQQLSGDIYDSINQLKSDVQKGSGAALDTLNKSNAMVDLAPVYSQIDTSIDKLTKAGTDESLAAADKLQAYKTRLMSNNWSKIPAPDAKALIQGLDKATTYSPMAGSFDQAKNAAFKGVRSALDQSVKSTVPEYAAAMEPVAANSSLLNRVQDFGDKQTAAGLLGRINAPNQMEQKAALQELGQKYGTDFVSAAQPENLPEQAILNKATSAQEALRPDRVADKIDQTVAGSRQKAVLDAAQSDLAQSQGKLAQFKSLAPNAAGQTTAQQKLVQLGKGNNIELTDMFQKLGKLSNTDFVQAMKDQNTLAAFQKGATNGSRNTLMGAVAGWMFGGTMGAGYGAAAGRAVDQYGPAMTKKVLDGVLQVSKSPTMATIADLNLPPEIKQNMAMGLKQYLAKEPSQIAGQIRGPSLPSVASGQQQSRSPATGEDRWAQQGIQKLGIQDSDLTNRLLQDPKGKQLLIQASDLAPGSKAMQRIQDQIKKGWGSK